MTLPIDTAEEPELRRWLAERPCPGSLHSDREGLEVTCPFCNDLGLAFAWASELCIGWCELHQTDDSAHRCRDFDGMCNHTTGCICLGSGRVPKANLGLADLFVLFAGPGAKYEIHVETNWDCPHEFATAGKEEDEHMDSPCDQAVFTSIVIRGRETAYEIEGAAEGSEANTELLMLAALRAVAKAGMR